MARKHETESKDDGDSSHHTKHSNEGSSPGHRSHDRNDDGSKSNDHYKEHSSGRTFAVNDSDDGKYKEGESYSKGQREDRPSLEDFNKKHNS